MKNIKGLSKAEQGKMEKAIKKSGVPNPAMWLEFHYVFDKNQHSPSYEEEFSLDGNPRTLEESMRGIMKEARISNYNYVYWGGLYVFGKKVFGNEALVKITVRLCK